MELEPQSIEARLSGTRRKFLVSYPPPLFHQSYELVSMPELSRPETGQYPVLPLRTKTVTFSLKGIYEVPVPRKGKWIFKKVALYEKIS